jgi:hypothetical protein
MNKRTHLSFSTKEVENREPGPRARARMHTALKKRRAGRRRRPARRFFRTGRALRARPARGASNAGTGHQSCCLFLKIRTAIFGVFFICVPKTHTHQNGGWGKRGGANTILRGDRGALQCHWNVIATKQLGLVPVSQRGLLSNLQEQSSNKQQPSQLLLRLL